MINSRDTYTNCNPKPRETFEFPYRLGTIIELKQDKNILARICQYRITVEDCQQVIYVGLSFKIDEKKEEVEWEITKEELKEKWIETNKLIIGKLNYFNFLHIKDFQEHFLKEYTPFFKDDGDTFSKEHTELRELTKDEIKSIEALHDIYTPNKVKKLK